MAMMDTVYYGRLCRRACGSRRLAWSKDRRPPGAVSVFIAWTEWTLAMALPWWQHMSALSSWLLLLLLWRNNILITAVTDWMSEHFQHNIGGTWWMLPPELLVTMGNLILDWRQYYTKHDKLHWQPIIEMIEYRSSVWWRGQAPRYLADHLIPASDAAPRRRRLRSANRNCLTVMPRCRLSTYGCRAFDYAGPTAWNSPPDELGNSDSLDSFKRFMKTLSLAATSVTSALEAIL